VVVAGAGVAAHGAVTGLRQAGYPGEIVVVGREPYPPYERPPLSKRYLLGELDRGQILLPPLQASLRLEEEVSEIEPDAHRVRLRGGDTLEYSRLLLATGSRPRLLTGPSIENVVYLRDLSEADHLRGLLAAGGPVQLVGAGFIGCEVAAAARTLGLPVTLYEALEQPLLRVLGPEVGRWLGDVHRARGVTLVTGTRELRGLEGWVLAGVGTEPNGELAQAAGIEYSAGILVDELGRTSAPDVYAAGDCARFWSPIYETHVRVEHFQTASRHGLAVGRTIAGDGRPFGEAPWFWSDQYDLAIHYVGGGLGWDATVVRGRLGVPPFTVFYVSNGRLMAAAGVNDHRTISHTRRLLEARAVVSVEQLADPDVDLKKLVPR
jgi:3-phenylpropionate/trans-cinnamate dioxygenase ferredoxin reductase subunit